MWLSGGALTYLCGVLGLSPALQEKTKTHEKLAKRRSQITLHLSTPTFSEKEVLAGGRVPPKSLLPVAPLGLDSCLFCAEHRGWEVAGSSPQPSTASPVI